MTHLETLLSIIAKGGWNAQYNGDIVFVQTSKESAYTHVKIWDVARQLKTLYDLHQPSVSNAIYTAIIDTDKK